MPACVTIGNFDGVHLGHQSLISLARQIAAKEDLDFFLITFWPHPMEVLRKGFTRSPLQSRAEKQRNLRLAGAERIIEFPFTPELAAQSSEEFVVGELLPMGISKLVIGHDFSLGHRRDGNAARLSELGLRFGFEVVQAPAFSVDGIPVSSTRLRKAIQACHCRIYPISWQKRIRIHKVCGWKAKFAPPSITMRDSAVDKMASAQK